MFSIFLFFKYSGNRLSIRAPHFCWSYPTCVRINMDASSSNCCCMSKSFFFFLYLSYNCSKLNSSPAAIFASLINASAGTPPRTRRISFPSRLMNTMVGNASTLYFLTISLFSLASTSTCTHTKRELKYSPISGCVNTSLAIALHGPHHSAQKSTNKSFFSSRAFFIASSNVPLNSVI